AGREHRVEEEDVAIGNVVRQLHEVLDRLERLLVAIEADEADARARDQGENGVEHPDAGAQDRTDGDLLAGDPSRGRALHGRLDLDLLVREILRRLVGQKERELVDELPELLGRRRDVAQEAELVLDERVVDLDDRPSAGDGGVHVTYSVYPRKP